jgi:uncharacterized membrane protein YfcA
MIGGAVGAYALASLPADAIKLWVAAYLAFMGVRIIVKAWNGQGTARVTPYRVEALGFVGGLLDALGGGGWDLLSPLRS